VARYERIAAAIRDRILAGEYAPGERLPRQRDLASIWKTTLPTVRHALDQLQRDGLLRVEHGVGTFVADLDGAFDPFTVASFTEALRERGLDVETRLLDVNTHAPSPTAAAALRRPEEEELVCLTRLRLVGGWGIVYQRSHLAGRYRAQLRRYDGMAPLYTFLRDRLGLVAAAYREALTAETTPEHVAETLRLPVGAPVLVSRRTTATVDGQPFLYDEAYLPPDRVQVVVTRQGTRCVTDLVPVLATTS